MTNPINIPMAPRQLLLLLLLLFILCQQDAISLPSQLPNHLDSDRLALFSLKSSFSDLFGALVSWGNESLHFCQWHGVTCGRGHPERVVGLDLNSLNLTGTISPSLANLTFLRRIDLANNNLRGHMPPELGNLFFLQHLNLSFNSIEGIVPPSLGNCSNLKSISLWNNKLQGEILSHLSKCLNLQIIDLRHNMIQGFIPSSVGNLSHIAALYLYENTLSGEIPETIGHLHSLAYLGLGFNSLFGSIPLSLGNLSNLSFLSLSSNNLEGSIPPSLYNLSNLQTLGMGSNHLYGELPSTMGLTLPALRVLYMYENRFEGPVPSSLSNAVFLESIDLSVNGFSGIIPLNLGMLQRLSTLNLGANKLEADFGWTFLASLTNCSKLRELDLSSNMITGILPNTMINFSTRIEVLHLEDNRLSGRIPEDIGSGNLGNLVALYLGRNMLSGTIPNSIQRLRKLNVLDLNRNKLTGEVPLLIGNLTELIELYFDYNEFSGSIPTSLENCQQLNLLNLRKNKFTGMIPKGILNIPALSLGLDLSNNLLSGSVPSEIGQLTNLQALVFSNNTLSGEIPSNLGQCQILEYLHLEGNFFHGVIPSTLSSLKGIREMDLSNNNLTGSIPSFFADFPYLNHLDLSFNELEGEVPKGGVFKNSSAVSIIGNGKFCGGSPALGLPQCPLKAPLRKHKFSTLALIISISSAIPCLILLFCYFYIQCRNPATARKLVAMRFMKNQLITVSYNELLKATDGFSAANLIGVGSYGSVYRGVLGDHNNLKVVAIKVLNLDQREANKSFAIECEALRNIRHRNLIKVLTSCSSVDFKGNNFKALVFDFMPNGSLEEWLHPSLNEHQSVVGNLTLEQRLNIAIDVASALDYLHNHGSTPVVHCDLKPSNILLDEDMTAHVGDFGLARFLTRTGKSSQNSSSFSELRGTIGYIAPEYGVANRVSTHGDVYSYGILILEMFTGMKPTNDIFKDGLSLHKFVKTSIPERVRYVTDGRLLFGKDNEQDNTIKAHMSCISSVLRIGLSCSKKLPMERMQIKDVAKELCEIRTHFLAL